MKLLIAFLLNWLSLGLIPMRSWPARQAETYGASSISEDEFNHPCIDPNIVPLDLDGIIESSREERAALEAALEAQAKMPKRKPRRKRLTWEQWNSGDSTDCWAGRPHVGEDLWYTMTLQSPFIGKVGHKPRMYGH